MKPFKHILTTLTGMCNGH